MSNFKIGDRVELVEYYHYNEIGSKGTVSKVDGEFCDVDFDDGNKTRGMAQTRAKKIVKEQFTTLCFVGEDTYPLIEWDTDFIMYDTYEEAEFEAKETAAKFGEKAYILKVLAIAEPEPVKVNITKV